MHKRESPLATGHDSDVEGLFTTQFEDMMKQYHSSDTQLDAQGNYKVHYDSNSILKVGYGHVIVDWDNLSINDTISKERAQELFKEDLLRASKECVFNFHDTWHAIPAKKKQVLIAMHFEIGTERVHSFKKMREAIAIQNWTETGNQMRKYKWDREDLIQIMEYEGNIEAVTKNEGKIGDILLQIEKSRMNRFYGLNIDKLAQRINFIGKEMLLMSDNNDKTDNNYDYKVNSNESDEFKIDEKKNDSNYNYNYNSSCDCIWYYFYTFLLMLYEKGDCDGISFSLNIDGKINQANKNKHHRLKKVYNPESHLRSAFFFQLIVFLSCFLR